MAKLDWLVVRDFSLIESATWWKDGPEIETGELRTEDIGTEVFFLPAAAHTEKDGSFTNTQRMLQWHHQAVEPAGAARSDLWFAYHLGRLIREKLAASDQADAEMNRPVLDLTWDYPLHGPRQEPLAEAVLAEVNGWDADGKPVSSYTQLKDDGSTASGCWIYCGVYADGVNQAARRKPGGSRTGSRPSGAGPGRPTAASCTTGPRPIRTASPGASARPWSGGTRTRASGPATTSPTSWPTGRRPTGPRQGATGVAAIAGDDAFIMQADGKAWLFAPAGLLDGPLPTHYEPQDSPVQNLLYPKQERNPVRQILRQPGTPYQPSGDEPGSDVFPYVATTYRLTEHHTAGGMSRWLPYLSELQPEFFCEVSPELAAERGLEHMGWATIITARSAIEARVMVTRRMTVADHPGPPPAPDRAAVPLGPQRHLHRRRRQRADALRPRPERAYPGVQGAGLRHPARPAAARPSPAGTGAVLCGTGRYHRRNRDGGVR